MSALDTGEGYINIDGQLVEKDALYIVEKIKQYDPNLDVMCLDPHLADINDAPFVIICQREDGTYYRVFEAWELDDRILERLYYADGARRDTMSSLLNLQEQARREKEDRYKEQSLANIELVTSVINNKKSSFKFKDGTGELVTIHDDKPSTRGHGRTYSYT